MDLFKLIYRQKLLGNCLRELMETGHVYKLFLAFVLSF